MAVVVGTKALKEPKDPAAILGRSIRQLMSRPAIQAGRNNDVFVDVKRRHDSLSENIHDVVIGVGPIMEFSAERSLPFLGLQDAVSVGGMKHETFEIQFADTANHMSLYYVEIRVVRDSGGALA